jgi:hypothetical protein
MSLQPFTPDAVAPLVSCQSCSWPMRLTLVAPLWDCGDAETHTYECSFCKHRQSYKRSIKQYGAAVAAPKPVVPMRTRGELEPLVRSVFGFAGHNKMSPAHASFAAEFAAAVPASEPCD